ncbi:MAG: hypothetical protein AAFN30_01755 [Actinomycetota bacterium]
MSAAIRPLVAVLAALALLAAACSSNDGDDAATETADDTTTTTAAPVADDEDAPADDEPEAAAPVEKPSLSVTAVSFSTNTVTISNNGDSDVSLAGYFLCNRPTYIGAPETTIAPGTTADIDVTDLDLRASGGEFGLYLSADFGSADAIVAYVQWGQGENGRASVAVEAGLIGEGEFVDNGEGDFTVG